MTTEEKAKAYDEAIERANSLLSGNQLGKAWIYKLLPELKESEDERIRNGIIKYLEQSQFGEEHYQIDDDVVGEYISWLEKYANDGNLKDFYDNVAVKCHDAIEYDKTWEKQDEKKPIEIYMEFKVGDWIVCFDNEGEISTPNKVVEFFGNKVRLVDIDGMFMTCPKSALKQYRLWTIQDARCGDVFVASDDSIFLFKGMVDCACKYYIAFTTDGVVNFNEGLENILKNSRAVHPATKGQRVFFFNRMKEAGYEWDTEKKELRKIEQDSAWSEEDENAVKVLVNIIKKSEMIDSIIYTNALKEKLFDWLKSLKPNHWKPSEKQLEALWDIIPHIPNSEKDIDTITELSALYEELKKL